MTAAAAVCDRRRRLFESPAESEGEDDTPAADSSDAAKAAEDEEAAEGDAAVMSAAGVWDECTLLDMLGREREREKKQKERAGMRGTDLHTVTEIEQTGACNENQCVRGGRMRSWNRSAMASAASARKNQLAPPLPSHRCCNTVHSATAAEGTAERCHGVDSVQTRSRGRMNG